MRERRLIFPDVERLSVYAARQWAARAAAAVAARGRFLVVLAGGETPRRLYVRLAQARFRRPLPWAQTILFWGDERMVSATDAGSNYGQARQEWLDQVSLPAENIRRIRGELSAESAAQLYAEELRQSAEPGRAWPVFDLVLLGLGTDGHTASLFPGPISAAEQTQPTLAVTAHYADRPTERVTLTPPVFNDAREVWVLAAGENKAEIVARVWSGEFNPEEWPIQRIRPKNGQLLWLVDAAAAGRHPQG